MSLRMPQQASSLAAGGDTPSWIQHSRRRRTSLRTCSRQMKCSAAAQQPWQQLGTSVSRLQVVLLVLSRTGSLTDHLQQRCIYPSIVFVAARSIRCYCICMVRCNHHDLLASSLLLLWSPVCSCCHHATLFTRHRPGDEVILQRLQRRQPLFTSTSSCPMSPATGAHPTPFFRACCCLAPHRARMRKAPSCPALSFTVTVTELSFTELKAQ
jgi:hypothetical protein